MAEMSALTSVFRHVPVQRSVILLDLRECKSTGMGILFLARPPVQSHLRETSVAVSTQHLAVANKVVVVGRCLKLKHSLRGPPEEHRA
jgi:hypothetical protein